MPNRSYSGYNGNYSPGASKAVATILLILIVIIVAVLVGILTNSFSEDGENERQPIRQERRAQLN